MAIKEALCVLLIFLPISVFGQIELGLKCGVNLATVNTTNIQNANNLEYSSIIGLTFGPTARMDLNDRLHLNSDFLFSSRGYQIYGYKTTINYLEMSLLLSYTLVNNLDVELGPDLGFKLFINSDQPELSHGSFNFIDFGASTGLRYSLLDRFFLSGRYYYGLTSIATLYRTSSSGSKTFNRVFQITIGYKLLNRR